MKKIEAMLKAEKTVAEFVVISFDSEHDNSDRLKHFQTHNDLTGSHWHLMTGSERDTRKIANMLDIKFSKRPGSNEIMHDNKIILLDESGKIVRVLDGLKTDKMELF
jgi:cytochrome oxidase Cu insertion factor (SCO1/SenC/PrrC family)